MGNRHEERLAEFITESDVNRELQTLKLMGHELKGVLHGMALAQALGFDTTESMRKRFPFESHPFVRKEGKQWSANTTDVAMYLASKRHYQHADAQSASA